MKLLPLTYFGSTAYYSMIINDDCAFCMEELYQKQTLRNRTVIVTSQGQKNLTVPVERPFGAKTKIEEVKISYAEDWRKVHFKSIESAYRHSPFFEFFEAELIEFYSKEFTMLIDLNLASQELVFKWLQLDLIQVSTNIDEIDNSYSGKANECKVELDKYWQVFLDRLEFVPNASILDLIFCEGNSASIILRK